MSKMRYTNEQPLFGAPPIASEFAPDAEVIVAQGDCLETLNSLPRASIQLVITSPPYNIGKDYEKATDLDRYLTALSPIVDQLVRVLRSGGSLCWQVGNYVQDSEVFPLDIFYYPLFKKLGLRLRNRIVWHFAHGLHANNYLRMAA